jgi:hypothetical protein
VILGREPNSGKPLQCFAVRELFSGALGTFKNPSSHREVKYDDPKEVADAISIANQLLRMVERI